MAQETSELWKSLRERRNVRTEYQFDIDGTIYGEDVEIKHSVEQELYESFSFGNATIAKLTLSLIADSIPRGATVKRYVRLLEGDDVSEWLPAGVYFINRRSVSDDVWTIEAFDAMRKADAVWVPDNALEFPLSVTDAVTEFARIMDVELDERTSLKDGYTTEDDEGNVTYHYYIDYPANEYTIRNELQSIAAMHGGNWIITGNGQLYLVPLLSAPEETNYLVTSTGSAITFGGVRILV